MFLLLIELFVLGVVITKYFAGKLPDFFLAVSSILMGLLAYFLNGVLLILVGLPLSANSVLIIASVELVGLILHQALTRRFIRGVSRSLWLHYLGAAVVYFGILLFFYFYNFAFATTDSVFMVVMAQNLIETGFSTWYFSSPWAMGLFVPFIQTIGILFGLDYTWFIQPAFMAAFIALFIFFLDRVLRRFKVSKTMRWLLVGLVTALYLSADLVFIMTTYIHTNFDSGVFFFLAVAALYFGIEEDQPAWFCFVPAFLIGFGAMRTENVIPALILILIYIGSGKIPKKTRRWMFMPYLVFQFGLYLRILFIATETFSDQLSSTQLLLVLAGIAAVAALLYLSEIKFLKSFVLPRLWWLLPAGLLVAVAGLGALNLPHLIKNVMLNIQAFFVTGDWGAVWWVVLTLIATLTFRGQFSQKRELAGLILSFFIMIALLGMLRHPYHERWFDSANRMLTHIAPIVLFYLVTQTAAVSAETAQGGLTGQY